MDRSTTEKKGKGKTDTTKYNCPHCKKKQFCVPCNGGGLCEHKKQKCTCAQCSKGKGKRDWTKYYCPHDKKKTLCVLCNGKGICEHKKRKYDCADCQGSDICKHGKQKCDCTEGCGGVFCEHGINKKYCKDCDGRQLCKTPHCPTLKNRKCDGYCWYCFTNLFPGKPVVWNYRTKENTVATFLKEKFPNVTWKWNKSVENGCSLRRPDLLRDMGNHIVIVEVDEHSHVGYDPTCEEKRLGEIWGDVDRDGFSDCVC